MTSEKSNDVDGTDRQGDYNLLQERQHKQEHKRECFMNASWLRHERKFSNGSWRLSSPVYQPRDISANVGTEDLCLRVIDPWVTYGRMNAKYLCDTRMLQGQPANRSWRYEPDGCTLSPAASSLHELVRYAPVCVTLVGDSLSREGFLSLLGTMRATWPKTPLKCERWEAAGRGSSTAVSVAFEQPRLTLRFQFSNLSPATALMDQLAEMMNNTPDVTRHVIVMNTAWHEPDTAWRRIDQLLDSVRVSRVNAWRPGSMSTNRTERRPLLVYRQTYAPDFPTPTGEFVRNATFRNCRAPDASLLRCEQSPVCQLESARFPELREAGFVILEGWDATAARVAAAEHIGRRGVLSHQLDCLHFCLPGPLDSVFTEALLTLVVQSMRLGGL